MEQDSQQQENYNQPTVNPASSPNKNSKWLLTIGIIICVFILVSVVSSYFIYQYLTKSKVDNKPVISNFSSKFFSPQANFELTLPDGWHSYDVSEEDLPRDLMEKEGVLFSFIKSNTSCVLTYGLFLQKNILDKYDQTSFAQRVFTTDKDQLDSSWYVHDFFRPQELVFLWEGEQPIAHEVRTVRHPFPQSTIDNYYYAFALYNKDGLEVDRQCDKDVSNILSSIKRKFNHIDKLNDGILYIADIYNATDKIVFTPEGKIEGFSFTEFYSNTWISPFLLNDSLYFLNDGKIYLLNLLSGESVIIPNIDYSNGSVNNFSIIGNDLFFLFSKVCNLHDCDNNLYKYNMVEKTATKLASKVKSREILGMNEDKDSLYLAQVWGDAGCFSKSLESYNFGTKELIDGEEYSGCEGEKKSEGAKAKYMEFVNKLSPVIYIADYLVVRDQKIYLSNSKLNSINHRKEFRYVTDKARIISAE
jgi:hypothetical protein